MKTETQIKTERQQLVNQWQALSERIAAFSETFEDMPFQQADAMCNRFKIELEILQRKTLIRLGLENRMPLAVEDNEQ